ncbi:MAG: hypothetical protein HY532_06495 [Chloroflexi bacterium]|nr:hypothetical protein [Chloroflexota bacterium]
MLAVSSGMIAGMVVGGLGSRIAMRVVSIAGGDSLAGAITDGGNVVGVFTLDGTFGLLLVSTLFFGPVGGLLYLPVQKWLPGPRRWRGILFGVLLFLSFGTFVVDPANPDFAELGSPALNVALFAMLFPLFGLTIAPITEHLDRLLPNMIGGRHPQIVGVVYLTAPAFLLPLIGSFLFPFGLLAAVILTLVFATWPKWQNRVFNWQARLPGKAVETIRYGLIVVFFASGSAQLVIAINQIV